MSIKKKWWFALVSVLALTFAFTACGSDDPDPLPEDTPAVTEAPTEPEDPPPSEPEETRWGPLAAEFLDLLATRNYHLKYHMTDASIDPDGDVTTKPDPFINECARQDDVYASAASDTWSEDELFAHMVHKDNKVYYINHAMGVIQVYEPKEADASNDIEDAFPVSHMEFIESGVGSVDGVSLPFEDYAITGLKTIIRIYIDGTEVAYSVGILEGEASMIKMNIEISQDIPSYMFEFPPDYPIENAEPPEKSSP